MVKRKSNYPKSDPRLYNDCILALDTVYRITFEAIYSPSAEGRSKQHALKRHLSYIELRLSQVWRFIEPPQRRTLKSLLFSFIDRALNPSACVHALYSDYIMAFDAAVSSHYENHCSTYDTLMMRLAQQNPSLKGVFQTTALLEDLSVPRPVAE